jgi:hypothetical protein
MRERGCAGVLAGVLGRTEIRHIYRNCSSFLNTEPERYPGMEAYLNPRLYSVASSSYGRIIAYANLFIYLRFLSWLV